MTTGAYDVDVPEVPWNLRPSRGTVFAALLVLAVIGYVVIGGEMVRLELGDIDAAAALKILAPFLLISLFIERALDVWVTAIRGPVRLKLEQKLEDAKALGSPPATIRAYEFACAKDRIMTQRLTWRAGLVLGLAVSVSGIRLIESLLGGGTVVNDLPPLQRYWCLFVDTLVTGAALGGGADGFHKMTSFFTDYLEAGKKNIKNKDKDAQDG